MEPEGLDELERDKVGYLEDVQRSLRRMEERLKMFHVDFSLGSYLAALCMVTQGEVRGLLREGLNAR